MWTCGYVYEHKGLQALGWVDALGVEFRQGGHAAASKLRVGRAALRTLFAYRAESNEAARKEAARSGNPADAGSGAKPADGDSDVDDGDAAFGGKATLLMLESMWRVSLLDIESTLRHVCNKVLSDASTEAGERMKRARALVAMGRVFKSYGSIDAVRKMDMRAHFSEVGARMGDLAAEGGDSTAAH